MYPSWFKYPVVRINPSIGLLSGTRSNRQSSTEIIVAADYFGDFRRHFQRSGNPFFIDPYVDKRNKRRDRTTTHHDNVLKVFQDWSTTRLARLQTIDGLYKTCIPLYIDVVSSLQRKDKYNDGILHLQDYPGPYDIVLNIVRLQNEYNRATSQFMAEREKSIGDAISDNVNISIKEWKSPDDRYPRYILAKIFEHFEREAYQHVELRIESYSTYEGREYYKLFREPADLIAVAEKKNLEKLKDLIDLEAQNTVNGLRILIDNIDKMQYFLNTFSESIDKILYRIPTRGLQGRCDEEHELRLPVVVRGPLMRFFRSRLLRNPPV